MEMPQGQRLFLSLVFLCGLCSNLRYSHAASQDQGHADIGFSQTDTTESVKAQVEGRPTLLLDHHGYIGVGCCDSNNQSRITPSPNNYWRILCPSRYKVFVVLMGMHVAPKSYLQVKTTQYEGCTDAFLTKRFNKKSIVAALVSNSAVLSAFKMAYVCVAPDKQNLASTTLESRRALEYFTTNEDSLDLFLRFLNDPAIILTHGAELTKIFELSSKDKSTNQEEGDTEKDTSSGEGNLSSDNLTAES